MKTVGVEFTFCFEPSLPTFPTQSEYLPVFTQASNFDPVIPAAAAVAIMPSLLHAPEFSAG